MQPSLSHGDDSLHTLKFFGIMSSFFPAPILFGGNSFLSSSQEYHALLMVQQRFWHHIFSPLQCYVWGIIS